MSQMALRQKNSPEFTKANDRNWNLVTIGFNIKNQSLSFFTSKGFTKSQIKETTETEIINSRTRERFVGYTIGERK